MKTGERILEVLQANPEGMVFAEIVDAIPELRGIVRDPGIAVRSALKKLKHANRVYSDEGLWFARVGAVMKSAGRPRSESGRSATVSFRVKADVKERFVAMAEELQQNNLETIRLPLSLRLLENSTHHDNYTPKQDLSRDSSSFSDEH